MQLALIGLPGAGVKTIFSAITGLTESVGRYSGTAGPNRIMLKVPDERLNVVSKAIKSRTTVQATVEILEFPGLFDQKVDSRNLARVRETEALVIVVRAFASMVVPHAKGSVDPARDLDDLLAELLLSDLEIVESRLKRLATSLMKRKNDEEREEKEILERCKACLDQGKHLRELKLDPQQGKRIRGFGFLTRKPYIVFLNIGDSQLGREEELMQPFLDAGYSVRALCGDIEAELAQMEEEDRTELMEEFGIEDLAAPILLNAAYQTLDLVTYYTHGENESRAWYIRLGETAVDAAGKVHTDLAKGFIRAEVISFEDFQKYGSVKEVKAHGRFRLEGKDYVVQDGDLVIIRHSG